jgi:hypothetical protein
MEITLLGNQQTGSLQRQQIFVEQTPYPVGEISGNFICLMINVVKYKRLAL